MEIAALLLLGGAGWSAWQAEQRGREKLAVGADPDTGFLIRDVAHQHFAGDQTRPQTERPLETVYPIGAILRDDTRNIPRSIVEAAGRLKQDATLDIGESFGGQSNRPLLDVIGDGRFPPERRVEFDYKLHHDRDVYRRAGHVHDGTINAAAALDCGAGVGAD